VRIRHCHTGTSLRLPSLPFTFNRQSQPRIPRSSVSWIAFATSGSWKQAGLLRGAASKSAKEDDMRKGQFTMSPALRTFAPTATKK